MSEYVIWLEDKRADMVDTDKIYKISRPARLQEPIVRCKDCKHYVKDPDPIDPGWPMMCEDSGRDMVEPCGFCRWGEKKEEGDK